ncbi:MAG: ATP-binding protein [Planctomycetota bacterium]|nr:ATP-binding protein [Planctomycetota bacterium]
MLIEFRVENYRSLKGEQILTMEAGRAGDEADNRPRTVVGYDTPLLPVAALYGANASGKSNVLSALAYMRSAVLHSHRLWEPDGGVPRDPFAWGDSQTEPSRFEVTIILEGVRYQYGFAATDAEFSEEWLFAWPKGKKQIWFERDDQVFKFGEHLRGENKQIEEFTRPNALYLSSAVQLRHGQLSPIYHWFQSIQPLIVPPEISPAPGLVSRIWKLARLLKREDSRQGTLFNELSSSSLMDRFRTLLTSADIGIVDIRAKYQKAAGTVETTDPVQFELKHQTEFKNSWLPLEQESRGTQTWFYMALPILEAIDAGALVLIDELESSLHPVLVQELVRQFNDPTVNSNNAQLIFTTHDTNLLGTTVGQPILRRDQIWLTEKDISGATSLYPLTDYHPRKSENLERGYLQGRFGGVPILGEFSITGE